MQPGTRAQLLGHLAEVIGSVQAPHPTRVAIDGPPATGKTTLADELAVVLRATGRPVIRATIDDFLLPRAQRYRRGEFSAGSCYYDTHDNDGLKRVLLDPLGAGGDRRFRTTIRDHVQDAAPEAAVLLFDGVFLLRPELDDRWELRILVSTALDTLTERAIVRESGRWTRADVERRWRERYLPAQQLYYAAVRPDERADVVVRNDVPQRPAWSSSIRHRRQPLG